MVACRAGNLLEPKRHIGLRPQIELHVGIDRERVKAFLADASPVPVRSHKSFIDGEVGLFADGALDRVQPTFYFLLSNSHHVAVSIAGGEMESQLSRQSRENA